jgi:hypothetical protein
MSGSVFHKAVSPIETTADPTTREAEFQETIARMQALSEELERLNRNLGQLGACPGNLGVKAGCGRLPAALEEAALDADYGRMPSIFFARLEIFIARLREDVRLSSKFLEISSQRKGGGRFYWGNVKKSGTKYMLSSERNMVTQTG